MAGDGILAQGPSYRTFSVRVQASPDGTLTASFGDDQVAGGLTFTNYKPTKTATVQGSDGRDANSVQVGQVIDYEIAYRNTEAAASTVVITDDVPDHTTFRGVTASDGIAVTYYSAKGCPEGSELSGSFDLEAVKSIKWTVSAVPSGDGGSVGFSATVDESAVTVDSINNTATVQVGENGPAVTTDPAQVEVQTGGLRIEKIVDDADADETSFAFTVAFTDRNGTALTQQYTYKVVKGGEVVQEGIDIASGGTIHLKAGEAAVFAGLPAGAVCTVAETQTNLWQADQTGPVEVAVVANDDPAPATVTVTNTKLEVAELSVSKVVEGYNPRPETAFTFTIEADFDGKSTTGLFPYTVGGEEGTSPLDLTSGRATVTLTAGQTLVVQELPVGTKITVTEGMANGYELKAVTVPEGEGSSSDVTAGTAQLTMGATGNGVTFTNAYKTEAGDDAVLAVNKVLENGDAYVGTFGFTLARNTEKNNGATFDAAGLAALPAYDAYGEGGTAEFAGNGATEQPVKFAVNEDGTVTFSFSSVQGMLDANGDNAVENGGDTNRSWTLYYTMYEQVPSGVLAVAPSYINFSVTVTEQDGKLAAVFDQAANVVVDDDNSRYATLTFNNYIPKKSVADAQGNPAGAIQVGQTLTYSVEYLNTTGEDNVTVVVEDDVPANTTLTEAWIKDATGAEAAGTIEYFSANGCTGDVLPGAEDAKSIRWTIPGVVKDGRGSVGFDVTVDESAVTVDALTNTANVTVGDHDPVQSTTTTTTVEKGALQITKRVTPQGQEAAEGVAFQFQITLSDAAGNQLTGEYVGLAKTETPGVYTAALEDGQSVTVSGLPAGTRYTVNEVGLPAGFLLSTVDCNENVEATDPMIEDGLTDSLTFVNDYTDPTPEKTVTRTDPEAETPAATDGHYASVGDVLTYTITWNNYATDPATGKAMGATVIVRDVVPNGTAYVANSAKAFDSAGQQITDPSVASVDVNDGEITWTINAQASAQGTVSFQVTVDGTVTGATIENEATVKVGDHDPSNTLKVETSVPGKTVSSDTAEGSTSVRVGDVLDYGMTAANPLDQPSTLEFTDNVPVGTELASAVSEAAGIEVLYYGEADCAGEPLDPNALELAQVKSIKWIVSNVPAHEAVSVGFSARVTEQALTAGAGTVENTGGINVGNNNPTVKTNPTTTHVDNAPLSITKTLVGNNMPENAKNTVFTFTVDLVADGRSLSGSYPCTIDGVSATDDLFYKNENAGGYTLKLKAGQTAVISGLPVGATYTVTEQTADLPLGFAATTGSATGAIETTDGAQAELENTYTAPKPQKTTPDIDGTTGVGDTITYRVTWQNNALDENGRDARATVTVIDNLPTDKLAYKAGTARAFDGNGNEIDATINELKGADGNFSGLEWVISDVAPKAEGYVTFEAEVLAAALSTDPLTNSATIEVGNGSTVTTDPVETQVINRTLSVTKAVVADEGVTIPDEALASTFVFHVKLFLGDQPLTDAFDCTINGQPAGDAFQQPGLGAGENPGDYVRVLRLKQGEVATIGGLPAGARYEIAEVSMPQTFTPASADTQSGEVLVSDDGTWTSVEFQNRFVPSEDPAKTVKVDGDDQAPASENSAQVGDVLEFAVTWTNDAIDTTTGDPKESAVTIVDTLADTLTFVDGSAAVSVAATGETLGLADVADGQTHTWTFTAPADSKGTLIFKARVSEGAQATVINNVASVAVDNRASVSTNPTATTVDAGTLTLAKRVSDGPEGAEELAFTFHITLEDKTGAVLTNEYAYSKDGGAETGTLNPAEGGFYVVSLSQDQAVTLEGLPQGATYRIVEVNVPAGFYPQTTQGELEAAIVGDIQVEITNQYRSGTIDGATQLNGTKAIVDNHGLSEGYEILPGEFTFVMKANDETRQAIDEGVVVMTGASANDPYTMTTTNGQEGEAAADWHFGNIQFKKVGVYGFTIEEQDPVTPGMGKDSKVITVTVTVTDGEAGTFATAVEMSEPATFTNAYDPDPDQLEGASLIAGTKVLEGEGAIREGEFTFKLEAANDLTDEAIHRGYVRLGAGKDTEGNTITELTTSNVAPDPASDGKRAGFSFETITFTRPGTYAFKVAEVVGTDGNVEYSKAEFMATVTVTDDREAGKLVAGEPVYTPETVEFVNRYSTEPGVLVGEAALAGTKVLEGVGEMVRGEFQFVLTPYDENTRNAVEANDVVFFNNGVADEALTSMVTVNGQEGEGVSDWHFDNIQFKKVATYVFEVAEVSGSDATVTYSSQKYRVTVQVSDDRTGELAARVVSYEAATATVDPATQETVESLALAETMRFVNIYNVGTTARVDVSGTKTLEGRVLKDGEFTFKLEAANEAAVEGVNNGIVILNGIEGQQSVVVRNGAPAEGTSTGTWVFQNGIEFKAPGTYEFKVTEDRSHSYDPTVIYEENKSYQFTVTVEDNRTGELRVTEEIGLDQEFAFINKYAPDFTTGEITIDGVKTLNGRVLQEGEFSFRLTGPKIDGSVTATVDADGGFSFKLPTLKASDLNDVQPDAVIGRREKSFVYTLEEVIPQPANRQPGVEYNANGDSYTVTVTLVDDGAGSISYEVGAVNVAGTAVAYRNAEDGSTQTGLAFANTYAPQGSSEPVVLAASKALKGHTLPQNTFGFRLVDEDGKEVATAYTTNGEEVAIGDDGYARAGVEFNPLTYDKDSMADAVENPDGSRQKTFTYYIDEIDNAMPGVTYDKRTYGVQITVHDDGRGRLTCDEPVYTLEGNQVGLPEFVNEYSISDGAFKPEGLMKYTDAHPDLTDVSKLAFSFAIYPAGDRTSPVTAGVSGANGAIEFGEIPVTGVGEFDFDIVEDRGGTTAGGVDYDGSVYRLHLSVSDNLDGTYAIVPTYYGFDSAGNLVPTGAPSFTNVYDAADLSVSLDGVTKLVNGEAPEGREFAFELVDDATGEVVAHGLNDASGSTHFATLEYNYRKPALEETEPGEEEQPVEGEQPAEGDTPAEGEGGEGEGAAPDVPGEGDSEDEGNNQGEEGSTTEPGGENPGVVEPGAGSDSSGNDGSDEGQVAEGGAPNDDQPIDPEPEPQEPVADPEPDSIPEETFESQPQDQAQEGDEATGEILGVATVAYATDDGADVLEYQPVIGDGEPSLGEPIEGENDPADASESGDPTAPVEPEPISSDLGWHSYTLREVVPQDATQNGDGTYTFRGVTYDPAVYKIHVNVIDNLDGTLRAEVEVWYLNGDFSSQVTASTVQTGDNRYSLDLSNVVFRNTYEANVPARVDFMATKALTGRDAMANEFGFVAVDEATGEVRSTGVSSAAGATDGDAAAVRFVPVWYDRVGEHDLWVSEARGGSTVSGVTHDGASYRAHVSVVDNGDGTLGASVSYFDVSGVALEGAPAFNNSYRADTSTYVELEVSKVLDGRDAKEREFSFSVLGADGTLLAGGQAPALTSGEVATFKLGRVYFSEPGVYQLTVVENALSDDIGVAYDNQSFVVEVTVVDQLDGTLAAEVHYPEGGLSFVNGYKAKPVQIALVADKTLVGRDLAADEFTFRVTDSQSGSLVATGTNDADGLVYFDEFVLDTAGSYDFAISEEKGSAQGVAYDERSYVAHVEVVDNGLGQLVAEVTYPDGNPRFKNVFTPEKPVENPGTNKPGTPGSGGSVPKTADETPAGVVPAALGLLGVAMAGAGALLVRRNRIGRRGDLG